MLGKVLKQLRSEQTPPWSQNELARRAGVWYSHIQQIESGEIANPNTGTLAKLARPFGLTASDLLRQAEDADSAAPTDAPIAAVA